ncbi:MAG: carboxypeptidase-like regulatory domain-containing protein, partial [Natronosporangium sp.]
MPAQAQPGSELRLGGIGNIELRVGGGEQNVQLRVENRGDLPALNVQLTMTVPMGDLEVHIASTPPECNLANDSRMDCRIGDIQPDQTWTGVAQIGVHGNSPLQAGETRNGTAEVVLSGGGSQSFNVRLQGPDRPEGVPEVSGFVTDQATGEPIEGAKVILADSQGVTLETTTNGDGNFQFAADNIAPGSIGLQASKDGYEGQEVIEQGQAGEALSNVQLVLVSTATPTPSASPSPSPTASPTGTPVAAPAADTGDSGGSFFTTLLVILGIVFVLLGVAAIVVLIIRRRRERGEDDGLADDDPTSGPRGPGPRPGSHGVYRPSPTAAQTQVIGGRGGAVPGVGPSPALANAPTMMHQRGGAADATMLQPRAGAADETTMLPRAG